MLRTAIGLLVVAFLAAPVQAYNGDIGLYFDSNAYACDMDIPCHCMGRMYVYAVLWGPVSGTGITGAEYRIGFMNSNPNGWLFIENFDSNATVLGSGAINPVSSLRGVNVVWPSCQQGDGSKVLIETIDIFNAGCNTGPLNLRVEKHDTPSNAYFQCPLFTLCDAPVYTKVCLGNDLMLCRNPEPPFANNATCSTSARGYINSLVPCCLSCPPAEANCQIAVESQPWTRVKALYRD